MTPRTLEKGQSATLFERCFTFARCELQPTPGRLNMTLRCVISSTLVVIISMALQIPWLALSLIVMFYVTQSNAALTRLTGLMFFVGSTLAIASALLLLKFTYDQPLVRILIAGALVWTCMFLMRATQVGVVFFICAIVIVYVQSFVDLTDQADVVVRLILWVWVAVNYAILVSLIINTLLLPKEPAKQPVARSPASAAKPRNKSRLWVPDAFTHPVYRQFALKTTVATFIGYFFYVGTDWQGIHTVMLTCVIVAQSSLGATQRRIELRVFGAAAGSLSALVAIIWIVPQLDDLAGLVLLCLPIMGASAWLAAGSERISYAGVQMMFTFAMALLEHFGPTSNITEIRDRMIGICLGVALSMFIHCVWWPESEKPGLYSKWEHLLDEIVAFLRKPFTTGTLTADAPPFTDPALWSRLQECETVLERVLLEPEGATANASPKIDARAMQATIAAARELLISSTAFIAEMHTLQACGGEGALAPCRLFLERLAIALEQYKDAPLQHADHASGWIAALPTPLDVHQAAAIPSVPSASMTNSLSRLQDYSNSMVAHFAQMRRVLVWREAGA